MVACSPTRSPRSRLLFLLSSALLFSPASAYTWSFKASPRQCSDLTVEISGNDGVPPYRLLILPSGPTPLDNGLEVRKIIDQPFPGNSNSVTLQLKYPANSQLVAVVSDSRGFGSGGTSVAAQVMPSDNDSCLPDDMVAPLFVFSIEPPNQIVQCVDTRLWWDPANVQGTPNFLGIIPGGQSFAIPEGRITQVPSQGMGFSWQPSVRGGTTLILVGGDSRGNGTAGSSLQIVSNGIDNIRECLNDQSPSSTPGQPAGGSYPTSSDDAGHGGGDGDNGDNGGGTSVGAIVGGVVGGIGGLAILIAGLIFWLRRNHRRRRGTQGRPINLNDDDESEDNVAEVHQGGSLDNSAAGGRGRASRSTNNELPSMYQPEPFMVPDPTLTSHWGGSDAGDGRGSDGRPLSGGSFTTRSGTPDLLGVGGSAYGFGAASASVGGSSTAGGRKGAGPRQLRPVNIIQHDDAGPTGGAVRMNDGVETIELPPAYTQVSQRQGEEHTQ